MFSIRWVVVAFKSIKGIVELKMKDSVIISSPQVDGMSGEVS